jgi:hypothetical protein
MDVAHRREVIAKVVDYVFVKPGRFALEQRVWICPAGTAPDVPRVGDKMRQAQPFKPRRSAGGLRSARRPPRWNERRIERELKLFLKGRVRWPSRDEFHAAGLGLVHYQVVIQAGEACWAHHLQLAVAPNTRTRLPWTDERIRAALRLYLASKETWPTAAEFKRDGLYGLHSTISHRGGVDRWQSEFPLPRRTRSEGSCRYWTEERIRRKLAELCRERPWFPSQRECQRAGAGGMLQAMRRVNGVDWWVKEAGLPRAPRTKPALARRATATSSP